VPTPGTINSSNKSLDTKMKRRTCHHTNKIQYPSEEKADAHIKTMRRHADKFKQDTIPTRSYQCPFCNLWHTTKQQATHPQGNLKHTEAFKKFMDKEN
jgi:hypothetical protein